MSCANTFEIYKTDNVAVSPYDTEMYGEMTPVIGAHTTLEKLNPDRITWIYNGNEVWTAEENDDGTVSKFKLMALNLLPAQVIEALWVFDSFVVVRFSSKQISFFEKPLIRGYTESPMTINLNNVTIGLDYQTFEFGRNEDNSTECYLFGVAGTKLVRFTFQVMTDERYVNVTDYRQ